MRKGFNSTFASHAVHISARNKAVIRRLRERANLLLSRDAMLPHSPSLTTTRREGRKLGRKGREGKGPGGENQYQCYSLFSPLSSCTSLSLPSLCTQSLSRSLPTTTPLQHQSICVALLLVLLVLSPRREERRRE